MKIVLFDAAWLWEEYVALVIKDSYKHIVKGNGFKLLSDGDEKFQEIIPDFLSRGEDNRIVADTKYIPLDGTKNLSADRAAAIYYKTIMYMYRFNSNKGLLLYPSKDDNTSYPKDFRIIETNGSLVKIPMKISTKKDFWEFAEDMKHNEKEFLIAIKKIKA